MEIRNSVAVVTGGTGGLGWRICRAFAREGAKVVLVYRSSREKAEGYAQELRDMGTEAVAVQADVTSQSGIDLLLGEAVKRFGSIDSLVLDAAYNEWIPFKDLDALDREKWEFILDYNLTAPYLAIRSAAAIMRRQGRGRIITVSSIAGIHPSGSSIAYAVSKSALIHLTRCAAVALAPEILVNGVAPGLMEGTRMTDNLAPEYAQAARDTALLRRAAGTDDVADAVLTLVRTDSITGQTLVVDAGKVFP